MCLFDSLKGFLIVFCCFYCFKFVLRGFVLRGGVVLIKLDRNKLFRRILG